MNTIANALTETELNCVCGGRGADSGAELDMIDLQSLVSQRGLWLQMATNMFSAMDDGSKSICKNIR